MTPTIQVIPSAAGFSIRRDATDAFDARTENGKTPFGSYPEELAFLPAAGGWTLDKAEQFAAFAEQLCDQTVEEVYEHLIAQAEEEDEDDDDLDQVEEDERRRGFGPEDQEGELPEWLL